MDHDIRILVVSSKYPPEYSGSGNRAHKTYLRLKEKFNIQFDVLCGSVTENTSAVYDEEGARVTRIARKILPAVSRQTWDPATLKAKLALRLNYASEMLPVWQFLSQNHSRYDLVHIFGNAAVTSAAISFCNRVRKPLIVEITYDTVPQQYKPFWMRAVDNAASGFHAQTQFVCISKKLEGTCRRSGIRQNIWTRPNPVDINVFRVDRARKSEYRGNHCRFGPSDIVLVNVSKFMPLKNQIFLLDVLKALPTEFKLVLAGPVVSEGPNVRRDREYLESLKKRILELGLTDRVQIVEGFVRDPHEWMQMADVYVFPSKMEGLGTPMIESICSGVPVVASRLPGVTDAWIKDGENGYLSSLDSHEFARKVHQAAAIPLNVLEKNARQMQAVAGTGAIDTQYVRLIESLVQHRKG